MAASSDFKGLERMVYRLSRWSSSLITNFFLSVASVLPILHCALLGSHQQATSVVWQDLSVLYVGSVKTGRLHISFQGTHSLRSLAAMAAYERQETNGWADQWDKHFDEDVGGQGGRKRSRMSKVKAAATNSVEMTMSAATVSAQKVKSGTSTSLRWIKDKVQRKK